MDQESLTPPAVNAERDSRPAAGIWQRLAASRDDQQAFVRDWLDIQCGLIGDALMACVVLQQGHAYKPVARWPESIGKQQPQQELQRVAEAALEQQKPVVTRGAHRAEVAIPLRHDEHLAGVVAVQVRNGEEKYLGFVIQQLQWGSAWLINHLIFHSHSFQQFRERLGWALRLLTLCLDQPNFKGAATAVCTELATKLRCDRVSLGLLKRQQAQVQAISHSAQFDRKSNLITAIAAAMDEALDQKALVLFPSDDPLSVHSAQQQLATEEGSGSVCTIPLYSHTEQRAQVCGAITLEHAEVDFFSAERLRTCEQVALLVGPLLYSKWREDRWIGHKLVESCNATLQPLIGRGHFRTKLWLGVGALVLMLLTLVPVTYRVSADASIEGWTQRYIAAPIDGYIFTSFVKAGDIVEEGQPLFELDNRDLALEKLKWFNKLEQLQKQHVEALVKRNSTDAGILQAQINQATAQIDLIDEQLARMEGVAPFRGIVIKGDLSQQHGAPVKRGDTLLQIAPLDNYRIILEVPERDIGRIAAGQSGQLKLTALSGESFAFSVDTVTSVANTIEGKNVFRVEARLSEAEQQKLRPGMQGTGKINVGEASTAWIWTHGLLEWLRIWLWTWWH